MTTTPDDDLDATPSTLANDLYAIIHDRGTPHPWALLELLDMHPEADPEEVRAAIEVVRVRLVHDITEGRMAWPTWH